MDNPSRLNSYAHRCRLPGYDYTTAGAYFVTICSCQRALLFDSPILHDIIETTWLALPNHFPTISLDTFIIMPNHVHAIIWLGEDLNVAAGLAPAVNEPSAVAPKLGDVIRVFKSLVATTYLRWVRINAPNRSAQVWQRNYYERIIRNEEELHALRQYIIDNPQRWAEDRENLGDLLLRMKQVDS